MIVESPSDETATALAGTIYWNSGKPEEVAILFKRAMRLQPYHPKWYAYLLGLSFLILEKYDEAEEVLKQFFSLILKLFQINVLL